MRAFRPSHLVRALLPEEVDDLARVRQTNVLKYFQRAQAHLPLFEGGTMEAIQVPQGKLNRARGT